MNSGVAGGLGACGDLALSEVTESPEAPVPASRLSVVTDVVQAVDEPGAELSAADSGRVLAAPTAGLKNSNGGGYGRC
ncbi:hypothetical protein [Geodermatophilus sp. SYSU D00710]